MRVSTYSPQQRKPNCGVMDQMENVGTENQTGSGYRKLKRTTEGIYTERKG
jgi:hypothetical protein